jgi:hypothetical protein
LASMSPWVWVFSWITIVAPLIGTFVGACVIGCTIGSVTHWIQMGLHHHAQACDLMADYGAGAAAEAQRRMARALRHRDEQEAENWRKVALVIARLQRR